MQALPRLTRNTADAARWLWDHPWLIAVALCFTAVVLAYHNGEKQDNKIRANSAEAIHQFCTLAERDHKDDVRRLGDTYAFLDGLPPKAIDDPLTQFVLARSLPQLENEVYTDPAPPICDEKGRGLPEPDPPIPARPTDLGQPPFPPLPPLPSQPAPRE